MLRLKFMSTKINLPSLIIAAAFLLGTSAGVRAEATGPDGWRIANMTPGSTLNVRVGPGTDYPQIGSLPSDARYLRYTECVPYLNAGIWENFTPAQKERFGNLHHQWCFVLSQEGVKGWVNKYYLAEDSLPPEAENDDGQSGENSE